MIPFNPGGKHVVIVGGGISGLATAYTLQEHARSGGLEIRVTLLESSDRLGGKICTDHSQGFVMEGGPDSFLTQKPWAAQLAMQVGLEAELTGANPLHKKLYVIQHGRLTPMPEGVTLMIPTRFMPFITSPLISWTGKLRMGLDMLIPGRKDDVDESIANFIRRRLGREALEMIAEPLLSGIHVSDPEQQSLLGTFPRFRALEKQHGSLIRGMWNQQRAARANGNGSQAHKQGWRGSVFVTLRGGMSEMVRGLALALTGCQVHTQCGVAQVEPMPGGYRVTTRDGERLEADAVVLATPAFISSELTAGFAPELSRGLAAIRYVSTATVSLAYRRSELSHFTDGVGFIIPRRENRRITACTISSTKFASSAPEDHVLLRCFMGGPGHEELVERSDEAMITDARAEMAGLLGVRAEPVLARVFRWIKGNPQYDVGHLERVARLQADCAQFHGLYLTGSAYEGVGVPDCIHQGQQTAERVARFLAHGESPG